MDHIQAIVRNLQDKWSQVNRFTPQMGYQGAFWESSIEKLLTMRHKLQTIGKSCKHCFTSSQLRVESLKDRVESLKDCLESSKDWMESFKDWMESFKHQD